MKIEAKKSKLNLNANQAVRPGKKPAREPKPKQEKKAAEKPQPKPKPPKKSKAPKSASPKIKLPSIKLPSLKMPKIAFPKLRAPKFKGKRSVVMILVAVPALVVLVWLGMNLWKHSVPAPLFTESNLAPAPPADSNGCAIIYDNQVYNEFFTKDICDINLFSNAGSMEFFLDKTRGEYTVAKTLAVRDDVKKMMELYREIITRPLFADMAAPDPRDAQKVRVYIALHNSITATMITRMQEKKYGAAFSLMKDQLNLNIQFMRSARSMTSYISAMRMYEKSLNILKSMLNQFGTDRIMGNDAVATCREIGDLMRSLNPQSIPLAQIVMFEYILSWKQTLSPAIQHPEAAAYQGMKRKALVFFDRGLTQKMYDERWKKLYELAKNPTDKTPEEVRKLQEQRYTVRRFWWFHNAVGKQYLDSISIPVYQLFQESKNWTMAINQKQGEIVSIISSLKEAVKPEKKQVKKPVKKLAGKPKKKK
jgi:hypothetical protein